MLKQKIGRSWAPAPQPRRIFRQMCRNPLVECNHGAHPVPTPSAGSISIEESLLPWRGAAGAGRCRRASAIPVAGSAPRVRVRPPGYGRDRRPCGTWNGLFAAAADHICPAEAVDPRAIAGRPRRYGCGRVPPEAARFRAPSAAATCFESRRKAAWICRGVQNSFQRPDDFAACLFNQRDGHAAVVKHCRHDPVIRTQHGIAVVSPLMRQRESAVWRKPGKGPVPDKAVSDILDKGLHDGRNRLTVDLCGEGESDPRFGGGFCKLPDFRVRSEPLSWR